MVECLPGMNEALGSVPRTTKKMNQELSCSKIIRAFLGGFFTDPRGPATPTTLEHYGLQAGKENQTK